MDDAGDLKGAAKLYCEAMAFFLPAIECMSISCYPLVLLPCTLRLFLNTQDPPFPNRMANYG